MNNKNSSEIPEFLADVSNPRLMLRSMADAMAVLMSGGKVRIRVPSHIKDVTGVESIVRAQCKGHLRRVQLVVDTPAAD